MLTSPHSYDLHRCQFRASAPTAPSGAVDTKTGRITGVSLLTAECEAAGWHLWLDAKTMAGFHALLAGRRLKAYATHGEPGRDGTLSEVGLWENARIDGLNLRADFVAFDAWRRHSSAEFDTLFELAEKTPAEFGASLAFSYKPVWVLRDGSEVATGRKSALSSGEIYDPPAPVGVLRTMPSVRATAVYSADFVDTPAANNGLFSARGVFRPQQIYEDRLAAKLAAADAESKKPIEYPGRGTLCGLAAAEAALAQKLKNRGYKN